MLYKLNSNGNSNVPTIFTPNGIPTIGDTVYTNSFTLVIVANFSCAWITNAANPSISAVSGGIVQTNVGVILAFNIDNQVAFTNLGFLRITNPPLGQQTTWTGIVQGSANYPIQVLGAIDSNVILTPLNFGTGLSSYAVYSTATNGTLVINSNVNCATTNFLLCSTGSLTRILVMNGDFSNLLGAVFSTLGVNTVIINGGLALRSAVAFTGTNPTIIADYYDFTGFGLLPASGNLKLKGANPYALVNLDDGTQIVLSDVSDSPPIEKVVKGTIYDFETKEGIFWETPLDQVGKGVRSGLGIGTAIFTLEAWLEALSESTNPIAIKLSDVATKTDIDGLTDAINEGIDSTGNFNKWLTGLKASNDDYAMRLKNCSTIQSTYTQIKFVLENKLR